MARKAVCISRRPGKNPGQYSYSIRLWDETQGAYTTARAAAAIAKELNLDEKKYSPTSKTGALAIAQELLRRGGAFSKKNDLLLADFCASIWDWDTSPYIQGRIMRGLNAGREHVIANAAYVRNYIRPAFPALKLSALRPYHIEAFALALKNEKGLSNRSVNGVIRALKTPLKEAHRLGLIATNPAENIQELAERPKPKGIPTEEEIAGLLALDLDPRMKAVIMLGAICGLRLGEIQALTLDDVKGDRLYITHSWSKVDGLKGTKTGKERIVPLPEVVHAELLALDTLNPHGRGGFLIYGLLPDAPLDCRAIDRHFMRALTMLTLGDTYASATNAERTAALQTWKDRNVTLHSLRHFCNAELRGGVPDETLRKLTGHSTEAMTNHYDHETESDVQALADAQKKRILDKVIRIA